MVTMDLTGEVILVIMTVMMVLVQNLQCINASYSEAAQRDTRSSGTNDRFIVGPDGQKSVLADMFDIDKRYEHFDANGRCCCGLCNPGFYVETFCTCSSVPSDLEPHQLTECTSVDFGTEFMDKPNNSTVPYTCTENCKANQTKTSDCTSNADITCQCNVGWFNPSDSDDGNIPKECRKIPGCKAGEEPIKQVSDDVHVVTYTCQQCQPGYFKLEGNSTKSCEPHRVCQNMPGSLTSDVKCVNDDFVPSDGTTVISTAAPSTQVTQLQPIITTLLRRLDEMTTPSDIPDEKDPQPTAKQPEPTGKSVHHFGYETAFIAALIVIVILLLVIVALIIKMILMYWEKCSAECPGQKVLYSAMIKTDRDEEEGRREDAEMISKHTQTQQLGLE